MYSSFREQHVQIMIDDLEVEGLQIGQSDRLMLKAYIDETISGTDLLAQAYQFKTMGDYHDWWFSQQESLVGTPGLNISVEYVLSKFRDSIRSKQSSGRLASAGGVRFTEQNSGEDQL